MQIDISRGVTAVALRPTLVATVIEDGAVLLDLETKYFFSLNASGWAIVQLFETGSCSLERISAQCAEWGCKDPSQVRDFMAQLLDEDLVETAQSDDGAPPPAYAGVWQKPEIVRQAEPLQSVVTSAFDPSIPLAE